MVWSQSACQRQYVLDEAVCTQSLLCGLTSQHRSGCSDYLVELVYLAYAMKQAIIQLLAAICRLSGVLGKLPQFRDALT